VPLPVIIADVAVAAVGIAAGVVSAAGGDRREEGRADVLPGIKQSLDQLMLMLPRWVLVLVLVLPADD